VLLGCYGRHVKVWLSFVRLALGSLGLILLGVIRMLRLKQSEFDPCTFPIERPLFWYETCDVWFVCVSFVVAVETTYGIVFKKCQQQSST